MSNNNYSPNRIAALLVFKEHTTDEEIEAAMKTLAPLLERSPRVEEYDDRYADPVLYFP